MTYTESVIQAGGTPILISITTDSLVFDRLPSAGRYHSDRRRHPPFLFNESPIEQLGEVDSLRDVYDMALIRLVWRNIPMFGICRENS